MRKVREVLRLKFECRRSHAEIAASVAIGESTVGDYLARACAAGLTWEQARSLSDAEVEARLFRDGGRNEPPSRVPIDFAWVHRELSKPAVTLQTLWVEYRDSAMGQAPLKAYEYSRFCGLYAGPERCDESSLARDFRIADEPRASVNGVRDDSSFNPIASIYAAEKCTTFPPVNARAPRA